MADKEKWSGYEGWMEKRNMEKENIAKAQRGTRKRCRLRKWEDLQTRKIMKH